MFNTISTSLPSLWLHFLDATLIVLIYYSPLEPNMLRVGASKVEDLSPGY